MMTTSTSSSKPIRHSKLLSDSLDIPDANIPSHSVQKISQHKKKHSLSNKTLIDTSNFDSKSFINRSDGFNSKNIDFGISKSDKSLETAGKKNGNMVPILIVSKSKKLINKYQQLDAAKKSKMNYIKNLNSSELKLQKPFLAQEAFGTNSQNQLNSDRDNYDYNKQVKNKINHFTNKVCLISIV